MYRCMLVAIQMYYSVVVISSFLVVWTINIVNSVVVPLSTLVVTMNIDAVVVIELLLWKMGCNYGTDCKITNYTTM